MFSHQYQPSSAALGQKALVVAIVLILHSAGIFALHSGTKQTEQPQIIMAEVIAQFIAPPAPEPPAPAPAAPPTPQPAKPVPPPPKPQPKPKPAKPKPAPKTPPLPQAIADPVPASNAPTGALDTATEVAQDTATPEPAAPAAASNPPNTSTAKPSGGAIELPSSNAAYLSNPKPGYPSISRRMGEQGQVLLRVLVSAQGLPEEIEIKQSSGFERLDKAAVNSVKRWKFSPGKRDGVPTAMWNTLPINFVLE